MQTPTNRTRKITARPIFSKRPRKLGIYMQDTEYYSPEDLEAIREGLEQIKRGETVTHDEVRRRNGL